MFGRKFGFGGNRRPVKKSVSSAPRLMKLETRCCPTITAVLAGGNLNITGNGGSDHVRVFTEDDGDIRVLGNNGSLSKVFDGNAVVEIRANLGDGFNNLDIDLTISNGGDFDHDGFDQNPIIKVTTGKDSDTVTVNLGDFGGGGGGGGGDDDGRGDVYLTVNSGSGNDSITVVAGGDFGGSLFMEFKTGSGNDYVDVALDGDVDGDAYVGGFLGTGNDYFYFTVTGDIKSEFIYECLADSGKDYATVDVGGTISGNFNGSVDLGSGNDDWHMSVGGDLSGEYYLELQGGTGNDYTSLGVNGNVDCPCEIYVDLGSSNDSWTFAVGGDMNGDTVMVVEGQSGNDFVGISVGGDINGLTYFGVFLGSGNDELEVTVNGNIVSDAEVVMEFDGGIGLDTTTYNFAPGELQDIDFSSIFFEVETYNEIGQGGGITPIIVIANSKYATAVSNVIS